METNFHSELSMPFSEKLRIIPSIFGIHLEEQPYYEILRSDGPFEIRYYHPQMLATIALEKPSEEAKKEAFTKLADYLFGKNKSGEKMAMTTPVVQEPKGITFILPQEYNIRKEIPAPVDNRIILRETAFKCVATVSYTGANSDEKIAEHTMELKRWLRKHPWYLSIGEVQKAVYDGPLTLPFLRKNELHLEVKNMH